MTERFSYVRYDQVRAEKQQEAKRLMELVESFIDKQLPKGRPASLALTALEECYMWVGKAVRDEQIAVDGQAIEEAHRGEELVNTPAK
jgi:hypothetical protein